MLPTFKEIRIENTNRCGHACFFCPREKLTRDQGVMGVEDFRFLLGRLSDAIPDFRRLVHLHGYGEPLLDKNLPDKVRLTRRTWPECGPWITSTLGLRVSEDYLRALVDSGLKVLKVSVYGLTRESYRKVHGVDMYDVAMANLDRVTRLAAEAGSGLVIDTKDAFHDIHDSIGMTDELSGRPAGTKLLHNYGNGRAYNPPGTGPRHACSIIEGHRREILVVTWDLKVVPCSFDFDATVVFGDLRGQSLAEVFDSPACRAFITAHRTGRAADYPVCGRCDAGPFVELPQP
ncbi:radical SAM/SPASM domain-containing protein [Azospirillum sp.]|uniref:radical SAM/SPASM domain-containing protein n=1 Tax=Azospirillum sp. TaxID=34012 RepID=UPI002D3B7689|nr:radical SAM/SPASM domain-containing protein [Azospirillum sp.]HYD64520.1 radical SAM/SPASM domain-containing protein [Azospirillum sp.]